MSQSSDEPETTPASEGESSPSAGAAPANANTAAANAATANTATANTAAANTAATTAGVSATSGAATAAGLAGAQRMSRRQRQSFRRDLLKRLPQLAYTSWQPGQDLSVSEDLGNLVNLSADAVLAPFESLLEDKG